MLYDNKEVLESLVNGDTYNYYDAVCADLEEMVQELLLDDSAALDGDIMEVVEDVQMMANNSDCVTGNASGSYFCNRWKAECALFGNFELISDALDYFGFDVNPFEKGQEWLDVTVRCYVVNQLTDELADIIYNTREKGGK